MTKPEKVACRNPKEICAQNRKSGLTKHNQMAAAVIDRIVHHGRLVQFRGESYRVRHALMQEGQELKKPAHVACADCSDFGAHFAQI